ncbi:hypothetical protein SBBP2_2400010 [Burkholderiales bacterium]|nr:hypothetical protein SBBP2_2400010 [Burkholderiales bacterium]
MNVEGTPGANDNPAGRSNPVKGDIMTALYIIFGIIVFVIPTVCILGDNRTWDRKK